MAQCDESGFFDPAPLACNLWQRFDIVQRPRLIEERLSRAIEAEDREPALAGNCLDPVAAALRLVRTEDDVDRTVRVNFRIDVGAHRRQGLTVLQLGTAQ